MARDRRARRAQAAGERRGAPLLGAARDDGRSAQAEDPASPPAAAPAAVAAGVPEFMFGISLASRRVSVDWGRTQELLGHTLRSLLNQSDPRFSVVICGHERPELAELADPRVRFVEADGSPPQDSSGFRGDKMRKRRLIGSILRQRGGGYFFPLDADDLVHRDVVAHALQDDNRRGYLIETGYTLDYANRNLAPVPGAWSVSFDRSCGSSAAIFFAPDDLPVNSEPDNDLYFNLFQSHAYWRARRRGVRPAAWIRCPSPAASTWSTTTRTCRSGCSARGCGARTSVRVDRPAPDRGRRAS